MNTTTKSIENQLHISFSINNIPIQYGSFFKVKVFLFNNSKYDTVEINNITISSNLTVYYLYIYQIDC